jgi:FG-GAP repeat
MHHKKFLIIFTILIGLVIVLAGWTRTLAGSKSNSPRHQSDFNGDRAADLVVGVPYEDISGKTSAGMSYILYGAPITGVTGIDSQAWYQGTSGLTDTVETNDEFGFAFAIGDYNGDTYPDLAVGVHGESIGDPAVANAGAVHLLYGTASGLSAENNQVWHQDVEGILDTAETNDRFGYALAAGDFNGDGFTDLAVGSLWEDTRNPVVSNAGMVQIIYGSASGLTADGDQMFYQGSFNVDDTPEVDDMFGSVLACGDFDGDGFADLAIGISHEDIGAEADAGAVQILYGAATGLSASRGQFIVQGVDGLPDTAEAGDGFGHALVTGDADGDGVDDLSIGVPYEDLGDDQSITNAGVVHVIRGVQGSGLDPSENIWLSQDLLVSIDQAENGDQFGDALAGGDFDGNGRDDIAVGVPYEDLGDPEVTNAGAVHIWYSGRGGADELWYQGNNGVTDTLETDDQFGTALASGDFNADGIIDLAIGVPHEDLESPALVSDAGAVQIIYGSFNGLTGDHNQYLTQANEDIFGVPEENDNFGMILAAIPYARPLLYLPMLLR